jgi:hypothetical protein
MCIPYVIFIVHKNQSCSFRLNVIQKEKIWILIVKHVFLFFCRKKIEIQFMPHIHKAF